MTETPFDLAAPLPTGVTVLEASAGTGKTFTIAALAARYVAEGVPLEQLLVVTFTRMATGELRERVRDRLVRSELALRRSLGAGGAGGADKLDELDEVDRVLVDAPPEERQRRHQRLLRAVANFDAATITTTHGFCQDALAELGTVGELEHDIAFVENLDDLLAEVVDDLYVRRFHDERSARLAIPRQQAAAIARIAVENPLAPIEPRDAPEDEDPAMRRRLAKAVRQEFERRKRANGVMTYDDLLTRLRDTLAGPSGPAALNRLRNRYRVVLIDEFQDTDPVQWEIVERAFVAPGLTLVLIADPKQAIYAFRGADVYAYLKAVDAAGRRATLTVNRRSDQPLIDAYDALFAGARLGHAGISYRRVSAAAGHERGRLTGALSSTALRIRVVSRADPAVSLTAGGFITSPSAREFVARDVAGDILALLNSEARIDEQDHVAPGDIAVLVQRNAHAALIHRELAAARIPVVLGGGGSVFNTPAAKDWLILLQALERPTAATRARSAALTAFFGWRAEQVARAGEGEWEQLHQRLHRYARILRSRGVATLTEAISRGQELPGRALGELDGERRLTDQGHVAQLLGRAEREQQLGTAALAGWLHARIEAADRESGDEDRTRRLESDARAVQVLTIHRSKGLEFPIVYCPFLWAGGPELRPNTPVFFHDPEAGDQRTIDVGLAGYGYPAHRQLYTNEQRGEDLRLAYVALTRARHQAVIWWAGTRDTRDSALARLLFGRGEDDEIAASVRITPGDPAVRKRLDELAARAPGRIAIEPARLGAGGAWAAGGAAPGPLSAAELTRRLDSGWRRTSYTDITAGAYEPLVASEPEQDLVEDEPASAGALERPLAESELAAQSNTPSLLAGTPAGLAIGTLVHRVLEATDFAAEDLDAELGAQLAAALARRPLEVGDPAALRAGLRAAIEAPLLDGGRLRDLARGDRLDELQFELPLAGGDEPSGELTLSALAAALRTHLAPADPLYDYAERLADPALRRDVRGYLTGTIDLVARLGGRFAIVDYKTNWLAPAAEELTLWHYRPAALAGEMRHAHYGLQAILYAAALHRYLRWRLPGYAPERHFGGVHYLFLRGAPGGGFSWHPSGALVRALSDALEGRPA